MFEKRLLEIAEDIHADNELVARELRSRLGDEKVFLVNLMSAPGSGKTQTILRTVAELQTGLRCGVIEADIDSKVDAEAVAAEGISAVQLNTGGFCLLDATMVAQGLDQLELAALDLVIIENVGNLVCPAEFDLGVDARVMLLSITEGDDKPKKYPLMFSESRLLILNKIDLIEMVEFDIAKARREASDINPHIEIIELSCRSGAGIEEWTGWIEKLYSESGVE